ncbi:MAG: type III-A CRISPR-associated protein Cas10/Csm1 [Chitinophagales bacterium]|nr:type III-A CRISPR-associated protein Cas10/Csm1 [Chitinophagales bacterium]
MKNNANKYLNAICHALGLGGSPENIPDELLRKAAQWAAGSKEIPWGAYQAQALKPVLATLKDKTSTQWLPAKSLTVTPEFYPSDTAPATDALNAQLKALVNVVEPSNPHLLTALQYHGAGLALSKSMDDLPLYDFIKISAAIAHCLENGNGKLRLIGGNISGIQAYLYDIVSKRAGKLLKGRSFYLQLLADSLAERTLEEFGLSDAHIVYASGGGFYIIAPDQVDIEARFSNLQSKIAEQLFRVHRSNLFCEMAISEAFDDSVALHGQAGVWSKVLDTLSKSKQQRLRYNSALFEAITSIVEKGGDAQRDEITNEEILDQADHDTIGSGEDKLIVSKFTKQQIELLGRDLREARYWITAAPESRQGEKWFKDPLGYLHQLREHLPQDTSGLMIRVLNEPGDNMPFVLYGGNNIPVYTEEEAQKANDPDVRAGEVKTFDALAAGEGLDRLGILRMDVDDLGSIFNDKIGQNPSFVRYAAVSRSLDWFFKGCLNEIQKPYQGRTVIIYSGGDDLFIVGRWLEVLSLSIDIQQGFRAWSCNNLSISGGIAILGSKFPVMQGAALAGEQEKKGKAYTRNGKKEKNALALFDQALSWEHEMPKIMAYREMLKKMLEDKVDKSLLRKLDMHAENRKTQERLRESPRWMWNMAYDLGRFAGKTKNPDYAKQIRELAQTASLDDQDFRSRSTAVPKLFLLQTAARWLELETRTVKSTKLEQNAFDND